jgi:hypothetical protein
MNIFRTRWPNGRRIGIGGWAVIGPILLAGYVLAFAVWLVVQLVKGIGWLALRAVRAARGGAR